MSEAIEINKTLLVVFALHALGGESDLEHIAVKAHELFPQQFAWRSFPQFPDKDAVRVHLSEAKKKSAGQLVTDHEDLRFARRGDQGYTKRFALTSLGMERAKALQQQLRGAMETGRNVGATRNSLEYRRIVAPITESKAFEQFSHGRELEQIGRDAFLQSFKLFPDASAFVITGRINRAAAAVAGLNDVERTPLENFIVGGRNAFGF